MADLGGFVVGRALADRDGDGGTRPAVGGATTAAAATPSASPIGCAASYTVAVDGNGWFGSQHVSIIGDAVVMFD